MKRSIKVFAYLLAFVNVSFFATSYSVQKSTVGHMDPVMFACGYMLLLAPCGAVMLFLHRHALTRSVIIRGCILGGGLFGTNLFLITALKNTSATATSLFPCLNGLLVAFYVWLLYRKTLSRATWIATICVLFGMGLVLLDHPIFVHPQEMHGDILAFLGSVLYTGYLFCVDALLLPAEKELPGTKWAILGMQLLWIGLFSIVVVLLFGDWETFHPAVTDLWPLIYIAVTIELFPTLTGPFTQRHVNVVSLSFIYILEPILSAAFAFLYLHERFSVTMYIGESIVILGVVLQTILTILPSIKSLLPVPIHVQQAQLPTKRPSRRLRLHTREERLLRNIQLRYGMDAVVYRRNKLALRLSHQGMIEADPPHPVDPHPGSIPVFFVQDQRVEV